MAELFSLILGEWVRHWPAVVGVVLLGGVLVLDDTAFAQTWLSQPLPAGTLAGIIVGDPVSGAALGLPLQLAMLGNLPVGQFFTGERITPLLGAVAAMTLHGESFGASATSLLQINDPRPGWLLLAVVIGSIVGNRTVEIERNLHSRLVTGGLNTLRRGHIETLERAHRVCLLITGLRGLLGTAVWALVFSLVWLPLLPLMPQPVPQAMILLPPLTTAAAVGTMLVLRGTRSGLIWMSAGFAFVVILKLISGGGL